jgi:hypothetical protein
MSTDALPAGVQSVMSLALWLAGAAHFCVLGAGAQAPKRLGWREDFAKLSRFNRRIFWAYYGFVGFVVIAFGTLTFLLHDEMLRGDRAAVALAAFIATWWLGRVLVDFFWYNASDWPQGRWMTAGRALLTFAFIAMTVTYAGVVAVHWCAGSV